MRRKSGSLIICMLMLVAANVAFADDTNQSHSTEALASSASPFESLLKLQDLRAIIDSIPRISQEVLLRRRIAQATFCLLQTITGVLLYSFLKTLGSVVRTEELNETLIVVTTMPIGASLGRYIFIGAAYQSEFAVRHEYGHTMQGYKHGPFFLLFEGVVSFVQAAYSMLSPSFAERYFDRWPENEANELGGIRQKEI